MYRSLFIAVLVCALPSVFCCGAELSSDLQNEGGDFPADERQDGASSGKSEYTGSFEAATDQGEDGSANQEGESAHQLDQFRNIFKTQLDRSADWVDGLIGTDDFDDEPEHVSGRVSGNVYWQDREGFFVRGRFRVKVNLDNLNRRFNAIIGRGDPTEMMVDRFEDTSRFASFYQGGESDEFLAGVGYRPDWAAENSRFSIGGGVYLTWPPAPYVNLNYRGRYVSQDEDMMINFYQTFYYRTDEGVGSKTTIEPAYLISDDYLVRWYNSFNVSEETLGLEYESYLTLYQDLGRQRALAYEVGITGETGRIIPIIYYGGTVTYRQQMFREWLYGEVTVGLAWPRDFPKFDRRADLLIGFGVEFFFGDGR